jgi:hypothetical protein
MKNTTQKPASKTSTLTTDAKKAAPKKPSTRKPRVGTAAWLIAELQKVPGDMLVRAGYADCGRLFGLQEAEVLPIRNGEIDEDQGEECFCLAGR